MKIETLVIGAGAVGLALAHELAGRGRRVAVVDAGRRSSRQPTSWAAGGILPPANRTTATDPIDCLRGLSHERFPGWVAELESTTGVSIELDRCGGWYLADTVGEVGAMVGMVDYWQDLEIECNEVSAEQVRRREPALSAWLDEHRDGAVQPRAWWVPDEYRIRSPRLLKALQSACEKLGVALRYEQHVDRLNESGGKVTAEMRSGETITAQQVALCCGAWTGMVAHQWRLERSVVPVRGQMLLLHTPQPMLSAIVNLGHRYLVPRTEGHVLAGSCEEEVGFQRGTTPDMLDDLRQFARRLCPALAQAREVDAWAGLRPMTFDGFPMIGRLPESESIYLASGHFRSGVHLSVGTADCLADLMDGVVPPIAMDDFRVGKQQAPLLREI